MSAAETVYAGPPVGSTVGIRSGVRGSYLDGLTAVVVAVRHFPAETSIKAQRAAAAVDVWATAKPDIPAENWCTVRIHSGLTVFLPTSELREIPPQ